VAEDSCEGIRKIPALSSLIGQPVIAAALGVALGATLTFVAERAVRLVTPADPFRGMVLVTLLMGARFMIAALALALFYRFAHQGLAPFGIALGVSFVAGLSLEAVRISRPHLSHTSA
jgi:hypothetical protein